MRVFAGQKAPETKKTIQKDEKNKNLNFNYCELYDHNDQKRRKLNEEKSFLNKKDSVAKLDENNNKYNTDDLYYCEIAETTNLLSRRSQQANMASPNAYESDRFTDSKINLFTKLDNEHETNEPAQTVKAQNLTSLRDLSTFASQAEAFHWFLNLINDTITSCIQMDQQLGEQDAQKRLNICQAHLLYARNFYEMRINNSSQLKTQLANIHPCLIALACLLDSDAVRIIESHNCACDTYIYLFSTRLKFCAWKSKLYIILKKPKRSSIDRLNLIEGLTNCHKLIQDKSVTSTTSSAASTSSS